MITREVVPFRGMTEYPRAMRTPALPGQVQGCHITLPDALVDGLAEKIGSWFEGRDEVTLVDAGVSDKQGIGFLILEWAECEIDPLFLAILRDEEAILDYTVYGRLYAGEEG